MIVPRFRGEDARDTRRGRRGGEPSIRTRRSGRGGESIGGPVATRARELQKHITSDERSGESNQKQHAVGELQGNPKERVY